MSVLKLRKRFPELAQDELFGLLQAFKTLDVEDKGSLDAKATIEAVEKRENQPYDVVRQALKEVGLDSAGRVESEDYVGLIVKLRNSSPAQQRMSTGPVRSRGLSSAQQSQPAAAPSTPGHKAQNSVGGGRIQVQGSSSNTTHTINEDERTEFTRHINAVLEGDRDVGKKLPFRLDTFEMFDECKDGLVLAKLINDSVPGTIDERVLNKPGAKIKTLNNFHMVENNNIVIDTAKAIGCSVVSTGSEDIIGGNETLIMGLIWQIIRRGLLGKIDIKLHPELYRLLEDDETLEQFLRLPADKILLRWFNYHLKNAKWHRTVQGFGKADVGDGENYTVLLNQLKPDICSRAPLQTPQGLQRAEEVLTNADKIGCRKFLNPHSLVEGNRRLNLAFVANLFNTHPCLEPITQEEKAQIDDFDAEGEREARVFTLWLNSIWDPQKDRPEDIPPTVVSFFDDLRDGSILLKAFTKVIPNSVNLRHVNIAKPGQELSRFKAVENTNYAVELGKQHRFSLVGIQGADITDGQPTLTLALVWQLMRRDILNSFGELARSMGKKELTDADMIAWANNKAREGGRSSSIRSFTESSLRSGVFFLDILSGMNKSYVDYDLVAQGNSDEESYMNAKLAISIARKLGATIYVVPEDISSLNRNDAQRARLITTFVGALMKHSLLPR